MTDGILWIIEMASDDLWCWVEGPFEDAYSARERFDDFYSNLVGLYRISKYVREEPSK